MTQTEEVRSGGGYLSQHDLRVHFGLGSATKVDSVEIRWPSGKTETLNNLASDKFYAVLEGSGVVDRANIVRRGKNKLMQHCGSDPIPRNTRLRNG